MPEFYVGFYGAVGDGVTDDRDAFQAAIDAAHAAGGGRVIVERPAEFYNLKRAAYLKDRVTLFVPDDRTIIHGAGGATSPYNSFVTTAALMLGSYTDRNWEEVDTALVEDLDAIDLGDLTVTLSTGGAGAAYEAGDVVIIREAAGGNYPTWTEAHTVEDVTGDVLTLRWPVSRAVASAAITRVTRTGLNFWPLNSMGTRTDDPNWFVRDAAVIGGTWTGPEANNAPIAVNGALNCRIEPYKIIGRNAHSWGNFYCRSYVGGDQVICFKSAVELALYSHDTVVKHASIDMTGIYTETAIYLPRARNCRVMVDKIVSRNGLDQGIRTGNTSENYVWVGDLAAPSANYPIELVAGPAAEGNTIIVEQSRITTQAAYIRSAGNTGAGEYPRRNLIRGRFYGAVTSNGGNGATALEDGQENALEAYFESGNAYLTSTDEWLNNRMVLVQQGQGFGESSGERTIGNDDLVVSSPRYRRQEMHTQAWWNQTATSGVPFSKTATLPADTIGAGDVLVVEMAGRAIGAVGTKALTVSFGGVNIGGPTIAAGTKSWAFKVLLIPTSNTAGYSIWRMDEGGVTPSVGGVAITGVDFAATSYNVVMETTVAQPGDSNILTRAAILFDGAFRGPIRSLI